VNDGNSPGANLLVDTTKARQILTGSSTFDGRYGLAWMPDHRLTYTSAVAGTFDIWVMQADGSEQRQLTSDAGGSIYQTDNYEAASSDGRYIVFTSDRSTGNPHVWRMRSDGSDLKQMTNGPGEGVPRITPDGHTIVYFDFTTELLWKMPIDGGQPTQITNKRSDRPYISPDGKFIACGYETENNTPMKIAIIGIDGGPPVKVFNVPATVVVDDLAWTPDGRAITYVYTTNGVSNLWVQRLDGTTARQLTDFTSDRISSFDFSPDGKTLALARGNSRTDIVLFNRID
jgi:Tol biopolymer transport system component